jgi:hypothetical protein
MIPLSKELPVMVKHPLILSSVDHSKQATSQRQLAPHVPYPKLSQVHTILNIAMALKSRLQLAARRHSNSHLEINITPFVCSK